MKCLNVSHMSADAQAKLASIGYDWQGQEIEIPDEEYQWTWSGIEHSIVIKGIKFSYSDTDKTLKLS